VSPRRFDLLTRHSGAVGSVGDSLPGIKPGSRRAHAPKDNRQSTSRSHQIILGAGIFKTPVGASGFPVHLIDYARTTRGPGVRRSHEQTCGNADTRLDQVREHLLARVNGPQQRDRRGAILLGGQR
jgi:hypothetical protein